MKLRLLLVLCVLGCAGASRMTLDDVAALFHDDVRWGRFPAAQGAVSPAMQAEFTRHHRAWGTLVHIMDLEVDQMRTTGSEGIVRMRVVWTRGHDSTDVRESLVEERWSRSGTWHIDSESVIAGDEALFVSPEPAGDAGTTADASPHD